MQTKQIQTNEPAFKCPYCLFMRGKEGSEIVRFEGNVEQRICSYCVKATEEIRALLPIVK